MSQQDTKPYVIINVAMTADGKIDTYERQGSQISSQDDWQRVDRLRAESDAVMVGGRTLIEEDPRLTVKSPELQRERIAHNLAENPVKVGVVSEARLSPESRFIQDGPAQVMIFTTEKTSKEQVKSLKEAGVEVFITGEQRVELSTMLDLLKYLGINRVLVEGGGVLNSALIQQGLVDEIQIYIAPLIFGGALAPTLADGMGLAREHAIHLQVGSVDTFRDGAILIRYRILK
ncbi:2,5-diamino-6-(ribosylamino)-4(3H)-pyrimidinone 5'-phosphate reductase [Chloroflexota bacterium]